MIIAILKKSEAEKNGEEKGILIWVRLSFFRKEKYHVYNQYVNTVAQPYYFVRGSCCADLLLSQL